MDADDIRHLAEGFDTPVRIQAELAAQMAEFNATFREVLQMMKKEVENGNGK